MLGVLEAHLLVKVEYLREEFPLKEFLWEFRKSVRRACPYWYFLEFAHFERLVGIPFLVALPSHTRGRVFPRAAYPFEDFPAESPPLSLLLKAALLKRTH